MQCRYKSRQIKENNRYASGTQDSRCNTFSTPKNISLVGFDDTIARLTQLRLTSVALPMGEIGRVAVRILLDRIEGKDKGEPKKVLLRENLVVRDSTARPPTR